jgi:alpha-ribazole phosphatase
MTGTSGADVWRPSERFVDLLRHGEAAGGACFRGARDDPLTVRGAAQMRAATGLDAGSPEATCWNAVVCSPARRCAAFAQALAVRLELPLEVVPALRARDFGAWEGQSAAEIPAADLAAFWADPAAFDPPGAEPFADFQQRIVGAWQTLKANAAAHQLAVTHGGVVRAIVAEVMALPPTSQLLLEVPHACRTRIRLPDGAGLPSLVSHGCGG